MYVSIVFDSILYYIYTYKYILLLRDVDIFITNITLILCFIHRLICIVCICKKVMIQ